jgi:serine/threonine protein kinase
MGQVYLAFSLGGRAVAVKVIHPELARDQAFLARFRHEVAIARKVSGAFTAAVVDASGEDESPPWLGTVFVPGPSLADVVADRGPLSEESMWRLAAGLVEALAAVHGQGLVHRDLKPANVLLAADGPRVIDFGIARALDAAGATTTGMIVGTPSFMSPEQAEGAPAGPASDVFSLGCVLVYAATGTAPFGGGTPASVVYRIVHTLPDLGTVPGSLHGLITKCLAKDPAERALLAELLQAIGDRPASADAGLSFWPPELADAIASYQAQLPSTPAAGSWHEPGVPESPVPHEPTQAATGQRSAAGGVTVTHRPSPAGASAVPPPPAGAPAAPGRSSRKSHRIAIIAAAAGVTVIAAGIAVGLALGAKTPHSAAHGSGPSSPRPGTTAHAAAQPQGVMSRDGVYVVGTGIKPGVYHTAGAATASRDCYYALLKSTNTSDIIDNNNVTGLATITVGTGVAAVDTTGCKPWQTKPITVHPHATMPQSGVYVTGTDIKRGVYHTTGAVTASGNCYYALLRSTNTNDIIDNNNVTGPATITIRAAVKAVDTTGCKPWTRVRPLAPPAAGTPAIAFGCKVLQTGTSEIFNVSTVGGSTYNGTINVSFYDYAGSGHIFPGTTVYGTTPVGTWRPVPAADIGASAEPSGCIAAAA